MYQLDAQPTMRVVMVNAGVGQPSSTRLLLDQVATAVRRITSGIRENHSGGSPVEVSVDVIDLRDLGVDLAHAQVSGFTSETLAAAKTMIDNADGVVLGTPIYKASYSGLFKSFLDVLDNDAMVGKPVILAASGGSPRHALAVDAELRPLAGYMRALVAPTALYASPEDWSTSGKASLGARIDRAAGELITLMRSNIGTAMVNAEWGSYQRTLSLDPEDEVEISLDPDLMRAATGGSLLG